MNREVKEIRVDITITAMYGVFLIKVTNARKRSLIYTVRENSDSKKGWEEVSFSASRYIIEDFKQTPEHEEMLDILNTAIKDHGY